MASSLPYAAPYTRSAAQARPIVRLDGGRVRFIFFCLLVVLSYVLVQLWLAGIASATLHELHRLETKIVETEIARDTLIFQVEELKNPTNIEAWAIGKGYRPLTNVEFVR